MKMEINEILKRKFKELRESAGLSQKRVSELLNVTQASVNRYETGKAEPNAKTFLWYADFFDVSLDYIYGRTDNPQGKNFDYQPNVLKDKMENQEEWKKFVELCFEPNSAMNVKLKDAILKMSGGGENNE